MADQWIELGVRVAGTYLGNAFEGTVRDIGPLDAASGGRVYTIQADAPINVSRSELFDLKRQRLRATLGADGASLDRKGRPDGVMAVRPVG